MMEPEAGLPGMQRDPEDVARRMTEQINVGPERLLETIAVAGELQANVQVHARGFTLRFSPREDDGDEAAAGKMADMFERLLIAYLNLLRSVGLEIQAERTWTETDPKRYL